MLELWSHGPRRTFGMALLVAMIAQVGGPVGAQASEVFARRVRVGLPARSVLLRAVEVDGALELRAGPARRRLSVTPPHEITAESVEVTGGGYVVVVRVSGKNARAAALLTHVPGEAVSFVWAERTDLHGDPGERSAGVIRVEDRTGDGVPDVIVGDIHERVELCGVTEPLVNPHAIEPKSMRLRPVLLDPLPHTALPLARLEAVTRSPGPTTPPVVRALRFVSASSGSAGAWTGAPDAPRQLTDQDPTTLWVDTRGGGSRGAFVTARWDAADLWRIRAIALRPPPADAASGGVAAGMPQRMWLVGPEGERIEVHRPALDDTGSPQPERWWVVPPTPLAWDCLSIVVAEGPSAAADAAAALAEVEVYTELDFGEGIDALIDQVSDDGSYAEQATRWLAALGSASISPLRERWSELSVQARRRALRVFSAAAVEHAVARDGLRAATLDDESDVRNDALKHLIECGQACRSSLGSLVGQASAVGDAAALALARQAPEAATRAILDAHDRADASERPGLRDALVAAFGASDEDKLREGLRAWMAQDHSLAALSSAALALAVSRAAPDLASQLIARAVDHGEPRFEDSYRLTQAAKLLGPSAPGEHAASIDVWLAQSINVEQPWMLKAAALDALAARGADQISAAAAHALQDSYPRVRSAAVEALASKGDAYAALAKQARADDWPLVRSASIRALAPYPEATTVLVEGLVDASISVRIAALESLTERREEAPASEIIAMIANARQWPAVVGAAIAYVEALCLEEARAALLVAVKRGLRAEPWPPDVQQATAALRVLAALGGPEAEQALKLAAQPSAPGPLQVTAEHAQSAPRQCVRAGVEKAR